MGRRSSILLLLVFIASGSFAQTKLPGRYSSEYDHFYVTDTGIITGRFVNGRAGFIIKGKDPFNFKNNRAGYIDTSGKVIIKPVYTNCSDFNGDFATVNDTANRVALINKTGKIVVPFGRQSISMCENGEFFVSTNSSTSLVDHTGKIIIPAGTYTAYATPPLTTIISTDDYGRDDFRRFNWIPYQFKVRVFFKRYIGVKRDGKWAVINAAGQEIVAPKFDGIGIFNNEIATMVVNKKHGVTDTAGNILVPPIYDNTVLTAGNFVIATKNNKSGVLSITNKLLVPLSYNHITQANSSTFFVDTASQMYYGKVGVVDTTGTVIIPLVNTWIEKFGSGYLVQKDNQRAAVFDRKGIQKSEDAHGRQFTYPVWQMGYDDSSIVYNEKKDAFIKYEKVEELMYSRDDKWGLLDSTGMEVTTAQFDKFWRTRNNGAIAVQQTDNEKWGLINAQGKVLFPYEYDEIIQLENGTLSLRKGSRYAVAGKDLSFLSPVKYDRVFIHGAFSENGSTLPENICAFAGGKGGFLNVQGKEITPLKYDEIEPLVLNYYMVKLNGKWGIVNIAGTELVPCIYDEVDLRSPPYFAVRQGGRRGLIDHLGKVVVPVIYTRVGAGQRDGKPIFYITLNGKTGIIDETGKQLFPLWYESFQQVQPGKSAPVLIVYNDHHFGLADLSGKIIVPLIYEQLSQIKYPYNASKNYYLVMLNKKEGVITERGKQVIPCLYTGIENFSNKYLICRKDDNYGLINWQNEPVAPIIYQTLYPGLNGFVFRRNNKYGLLNTAGKEITPAGYDQVISEYHNVYFVYKDGKMGLMDNSGKVIVPPAYDSYELCGKETIVVEKDHLKGLIDYTGKVIYPCKYTYIKCDEGKVVEIY